MAVLIETIGTGTRRKAIVLGHVQGLVHSTDCTAADAIDFALVFNQAGVCRTLTVVVVVQRAILIEYARGQIDPAVCQEAVSALGQRQAIGTSFNNIVGSVADCTSGARVEEVVVSIDVMQTVTPIQRVAVAVRMLCIDIVAFRLLGSIHAQVPVVIPPVQARGCIADQLAFVGKLIPVLNRCMSFLNTGNSLLRVVPLEEEHSLFTGSVLLASLRGKFAPALLVVERAVVVTPANAIVIPHAVKQSAVLEHVDDIVGNRCAIFKFMLERECRRTMQTLAG